MSLPDYGFYILCAVAIFLLAGQAVAQPTAFVQITIFGVADGAMYALVALGYTMVYGIIELINFAHGDVFTLGAYIGTAIIGFFAVNETSFWAKCALTAAASWSRAEPAWATVTPP